MAKNILITICARGGSKGVPNKNIKTVNGAPLIGYTINTAKKLAQKLEADIFLSTDSPEIQNVAKELGLSSTYLRPDELATDTAGKVDVLYDALRSAEETNDTEYSHLIDLDVSAPLRTVDDVINALNLLESKPKALNIFSVSEARKNPYFNMVEENENGFYELSKKAGNYLSRQAAKEVFEMNASFYIYTRAFFTNESTSAITEYSMAYKMNHICFDIDSIEELHFLEYLLKENKLNFEL